MELHVEQGRDLVDRGAAVGVASEIWPHGRYRFDFAGEANHAGTTRMEDRRDPMLTYAMTALAANKQARLAGERATFGRVDVAPNGTNAVPSRVTAWLDARCATDEGLATLVAAIEKQASERAGRDGTSLAVTAESVSGSVAFDAGLARRIAADHEDGDWPIIPTMAGHDAGILSAAGIPTAMLFVRNPTGVSHSPAEHAEMADCLVGVSRAGRHAGEAGAVTRRRSATYLLERAWVDGAVHDDVLVEIDDGRFTSVTLPTVPSLLRRCDPREAQDPRSPGIRRTRIPGLTIPGLANCHSHAFHRALRGRTQRERGTFWTWRDRMYDVAATLDPDSYFTLARATYREMAAAGITLRRRVPLPAPPARRDAVRRPERDGARPDRGRARGRDPDRAARHLLPLERLRRAVAGSAIALLRRVRGRLGCQNRAIAPERQAGVRHRRGDPLRPRRARRPDAGRRRLGRRARRPAARPPLRAGRREPGLRRGVRPHPDRGARRPRAPRPDTTVVHATHLTADDIRLLGSSRTNACFCPTTERDLGDGIGPSRQLHDAGSRLTLGSDSHAVIDLFEEMRAVELDERLATQERGHWSAAELLAAATQQGHASLGFDDAGAIAVGQRADLVTLDTTSPAPPAPAPTRTPPSSPPPPTTSPR